MGQRTNGSGGKPSACETRSRAESGDNVIPFPSDLKRRRDLEQQLAAWLTGLVAGVLAGQFSVEELEMLTDDAHQFLHDTNRCSCPR